MSGSVSGDRPVGTARLDEEPGGPDSLAVAAATGARWGLVSNAIRQLGRLAFTLVLARIVGPEQFGIVAQAVIYIGFVQLFLDQGFGAALIQKRTVDRLDLGSVFWLNVVSAAVLAGITLVLAPFVADFFATPELTQVLRVLTLSLLLASLAAVPLAMMNRRLQFRRMARIDIVSVAAGGLAGVGHALAGGGYWALVTQTLVSSAVTLAGLLHLSGPPPLRGSWRRLRSMLSFSSGLFGARIVQYAGSNGDNLLVGRFLGSTDLAFYSLAYRMLRLPTQTLGRVVNQVAFPVYSRVRDDVPRVRGWFLLTTRATAALAYPLLTAGVLLEPDAVPLLLGERWQPAVLPMQILTLVAFRTITLKLVGPVFMSFGRTRIVLRNSVLEVAATLVGCAVGLPWGIVGVATGYLVGRLLVSPVILRAAGRLMDLSTRTYALTLLPVWFSCLLMAGAWWGARLAAERAGAHDAVAVAAGALVGSLVYVVALRFGFRTAWRDAEKVVRMVLKRPGAAVP